MIFLTRICIFTEIAIQDEVSEIKIKADHNRIYRQAF